MGKKILFVLGDYLNGSSQNGICVDSIKNALSEVEIDIHILCYQESKQQVKKNEAIFTILKEEYKSLSAKYIINILFHPPIVYKNTVKNYEDTISQLYEKYKYDAVVGVMNPAEAVEGVYKFKKNHKNVNTILYEIDPVSNKFIGSKNIVKLVYRKIVKMWERKIYGTFDMIIHMKTHYKHFENNFYELYKNKTLYLDIPNFWPKRNICTKIRNDKLSMIYAGAFYPGLRNPDYLINLVKYTSNLNKVQCSIYTDDRMKDHLIKLIGDNNDISLCEMIPNTILQEKMKNVDILLSVGNKSSEFLPSKIFTYMSLGKPIVHILGDKNDSVIPYLKKYPLALLLDPNLSVKKNSKLLFEFIKKIDNVMISREELIQNFYENTPLCTAKKIKNILDSYEESCGENE